MSKQYRYYEEDRPMTWAEIIGGTLLVLLLFVVMPGVAGYLEHNYTREDCVVIAVHEDYVVAEDTLGYTWSWYTEGSDVVVGDTITLHMHTSFTHNSIDDDTIERVEVQ